MTGEMVLSRTDGALGDKLQAALAPSAIIRSATLGGTNAPALPKDSGALVLDLTKGPRHQPSPFNGEIPPDELWAAHQGWLQGIIRVMQALGKGMIERRQGSVVIILPSGVKHPHEIPLADAAYAAALQALSKHAANEWSAFDVRVNTVLWGGDDDEHHVASLIGVVQYLLSPTSAHIRGAAISVDGGHSRPMF